MKLTNLNTAATTYTIAVIGMLLSLSFLPLHHAQAVAMSGSATNDVSGEGGGAALTGVPVVIGGNSSVESNISVGDMVKTTDRLKVRSKAGLTGKKLGKQPKKSFGTVVKGPVTKNGYKWWYVDYVSGKDGWSAANWLKVVAKVNSSENDDEGSDGESGDENDDEDGSTDEDQNEDNKEEMICTDDIYTYNEGDQLKVRTVDGFKITTVDEDTYFVCRQGDWGVDSESNLNTPDSGNVLGASTSRSAELLRSVLSELLNRVK